MCLRVFSDLAFPEAFTQYRYSRARPCVPCVPCVSRLPPVSFYRYSYCVQTECGGRLHSCHRGTVPLRQIQPAQPRSHSATCLRHWTAPGTPLPQMRTSRHGPERRSSPLLHEMYQQSPMDALTICQPQLSHPRPLMDALTIYQPQLPHPRPLQWTTARSPKCLKEPEIFQLRVPFYRRAPSMISRKSLQVLQGFHHYLGVPRI